MQSSGLFHMISVEHCPYDAVDTVRYVIQHLLELSTQLTTDRSNRTVPPSLSAHSTRYCDAPAQGEHPSTAPRPSFLCRALQHSISTSLVCPTRRTAPDSALLPTLRHQCCHQHRVYLWGYFLIASFSFVLYQAHTLASRRCWGSCRRRGL